MRTSVLYSAAFSIGSLLSLIGCGTSGPQLAPVTGRVTLDGQPLKGANIQFQPEGTTGSPSVARTDENGAYELGYSRGKAGALVGWHTVSIAIPTELSSSGDGGIRPQLVPRRYNLESELRREVKAGEDNVFDFDLTTEAK